MPRRLLCADWRIWHFVTKPQGLGYLAGLKAEFIRMGGRGVVNHCMGDDFFVPEESVLNLGKIMSNHSWLHHQAFVNKLIPD